MIAKEAAPEIDRLVLSVSRTVSPNHGDRMLDVARGLGLDDLNLLPLLGNFMLAGSLTRELALARMPYAAPETVLGPIEELEERQLLVAWGSGLGASPGLRHLLQVIGSALAVEAAQAWTGHEDAVGAAYRLTGVVGKAASADHLAAVAHQECPEPDDRYQRLHQRLVTLRYIRQHDHVEAWRAENLTPLEIVEMTRLRHGEDVEASAPGLELLIERGYARTDPPSLTSKGKDVRDGVEDETNRRAQESFHVLNDRSATEFLAALRTLPGTR